MKRVLLLAVFLLTAVAVCPAQLAPQVAQALAQPQVGAGQDYIQWMAETVDPASGNVSLRICLPLPQGRGVSLPFCLAYDSSAAYSWLGGAVGFKPNGSAGVLASGGWSYTVPQVIEGSNGNVDSNGDECDWTSDAVFSDPTGAKIPLAVSQTYGQNNACNDLQVASVASGSYAGFSTADGAMTVTDPHGTTYATGDGPATQVMDVNGNIVNIAYSGTEGQNLAYTDTAGRTLLALTPVAGVDTITPSGLGNFTATWTTPAVAGWHTELTGDTSFLPPGSGCPTGSSSWSAGGAVPAVSQFKLPNGQSFTFSYDPTYGLLTKVVYPSGGYVRYVWGFRPAAAMLSMQETALCYFYYGVPVITDRYVSFDGTTEVLHQQFSYSAVYPSETATSGEVDSNPQNNQVYQVVDYSYGLGSRPQMPNDTDLFSGAPLIEQSAVYKSNAGATLRTVAKTWNGGNPTELASQTTTLDNGEAAETAWTWNGFFQRTGEKEYDYGSGGVGPLLRQTLTTYATFGSLWRIDRPASVTVEDGSGCLHALTNYGYDQYASLLDVPTAINHDDTGHGPAFLNRGNLTTKSEWASASSPDASCLSPSSPGGTDLNTTTTYDDTGQPLTSKNPNGNTTQYAWTDHFTGGGPASGVTNAYLTQVTDALGHTGEYTWNYAAGTQASHTDQNGNATVYAYSDALNRLTQVGYPDGGETTVAYTDTPGSVRTETKRLISAGVWTDAFDLYDGLGHAVAHSAANGESTPWDRTDTCYDGEGRAAFISYPYQAASGTAAANCAGTGDSFQLDALGRPTLTTHSDGTTFITSYTGRATETQDEGNGTARVAKVTQADGLGNLASVCEVTSAADGAGNTPAACGQDIAATGFLTSYQHDAPGNLTQVTQGGLQARNFAYDSLSRLTCAANPESGAQSGACVSNTTGATVYSYDGDSNELTRTRPAPNQASPTTTVTTSYSFDALDRPLTTSYSDGSPSTMLIYDQRTVWGTLTVGNPVGRLTSAVGVSNDTFSYDALGRQVWMNQCTPDICGSGGYQVDVSYDLAGDPVAANDGKWASYETTYNVALRPTGLSYQWAYTDTWTPLISGIHYNAWGEEWAAGSGAAELGNGLAEEREYDARGRGTSVQVGSVYSSVVTSYASDGEVLGTEDTVNGDWSYALDAQNRLAGSACSAGCPDGGSSQGFQYSYDRFGNRWAQTLTQGSGPAPSASYNEGNNQMNGYSYDAAGNLLYDGVHHYQYDDENRVVSVDGGAEVYSYDALGRRVQKQTGAGVEDYLYGAAGEIVNVVDAGASLGSQAYVGSRQVADFGDGLTYHQADLLGTVRMHTDSGGNASWTCASLAFGDGRDCTAPPAPGPFFTGKDWDPESGLDYFGARYYSSQLGRFLTPDWSEDPDPIPYADLSDPQSLNLYAYTENNPVTATDPDGHLCCQWLTNAYQALIGGGSNPTGQSNPSSVAPGCGDNYTCTVTASTMPFALEGPALGALEGIGEVAAPAVGIASVVIGQTGGDADWLAKQNFYQKKSVSPAAKKVLGKLADQADDTVRDVIRSRGGTASNVSEAGPWAESTLGDTAQAAAEGDRSAVKAMKIVKGASRLGQKY